MNTVICDKREPSCDGCRHAEEHEPFEGWKGYACDLPMYCRKVDDWAVCVEKEVKE